jgi:hypothetical protein
MIRILQNVPYSRFRKNEFRKLVNEIIEVVNVFNPAAMFIKILFDRLVAAAEPLNEEKVRQGSHPQTTQLATVRKSCNNLIETIVSQVRNIVKAKLENQAEAIALVAPFVKRYLKPIVEADWMKKTDYLKEMFTNLEGNIALQTAIDQLSLKIYFDELKSQLESQKEIIETRSESIRERKKSNHQELQVVNKTALQELFAAIELAQIEHPDVDYSQLINGINEKLVYISAQAKTRSTIGKKNPKGKSDSTNSDTKAA